MRSLALIGMLLVGPVWAQTPAPVKNAVGVHSADVAQWLIALLLVLIVFFALILLLRRASTLNWVGKQPLQIETTLALGVRERLVVVNVGDKQLLLGVTAHRIDKLLELEGEQRIVAGHSRDSVAPFAEHLQQLLRGKPHA